MRKYDNEKLRAGIHFLAQAHETQMSLFPTDILNFEARTLKLET